MRRGVVLSWTCTRTTGCGRATWTTEEYAPDWISVAEPVAEAAGMEGRDGPVSLRGAAFAGQGFKPTEIFVLGILDSAPGKAASVYVILDSDSAHIPTTEQAFHSTNTRRRSATGGTSRWCRS